MYFRELVEKYLKNQKATVKASTYSRNFHQCNFFLKIFDTDIKVNKLTAGYLKDTLLRTGKAPGTLNEHRVRLLALLRWGYENDYIEDITYLKKFKPFKDKPHKEKIQDKYLEQYELVALVNSMKVKKWELLNKISGFIRFKNWRSCCPHSCRRGFKESPNTRHKNL